MVMRNSSIPTVAALLAEFVIAGCAMRPVNEPVARFEPKTTYTFERPSANPEDRQHFVLLAFSGGGTRAAAFSYGALETLRDMDMQARWEALREVRDAIKPMAEGNPKLGFILRAPDVNIYVIDVSFAVLKDPAERDYLNRLPTSFVLPDEGVDRLRAAARAAILESPVVQQLMKQGVARMTGSPALK